MQTLPHILTASEIYAAAESERRALTNDEVTAVAAEELDSIHDLQEKKGLLIDENYSPYGWAELHADTEKPLIIAEGIMNCLAFEGLQLGLKAAEYREGLKERLYEDLNALKVVRPVIIALNNERLTAPAETLYRAFKERHIETYIANVTGRYRTAAEAIQAEPEALQKEVQKLLSDPRFYEYQQNSAAGYLNRFLDDIKESENTPLISTGFNRFDTLLGGGIRPAFYILLSFPSAGKSAFCLQIADQIAELSGRDILYASIEMRKGEHIARTLSRFTFNQCIHDGKPQTEALSADGIVDGFRYKHYSEYQKALISKSIERYRRYSDHLYFLEGFQITVDSIRQSIETHAKIRGTVPVVFVDYLQILNTKDRSITDVRMQTDQNLEELKDISARYRTPVIVISSINRNSYDTEITLGSGKESGAIEYSSDKVLSFEFANVTKGTDINELKRQPVREMQIKVLKNRNGVTGQSMQFNYRPKFNYFSEKL